MGRNIQKLEHTKINTELMTVKWKSTGDEASYKTGNYKTKAGRKRVSKSRKYGNKDQRQRTENEKTLKQNIVHGNH